MQASAADVQDGDRARDHRGGAPGDLEHGETEVRPCERASVPELSNFFDGWRKASAADVQGDHALRGEGARRDLVDHLNTEGFLE